MSIGYGEKIVNVTDQAQFVDVPLEASKATMFLESGSTVFATRQVGMVQANVSNKTAAQLQTLNLGEVRAGETPQTMSNRLLVVCANGLSGVLRIQSGPVERSERLDSLAVYTLAVTNASQTLQALITALGGGAAIPAGTRKVTFRNGAGVVSYAIGAAAVAGTHTIATGASVELALLADTALSLIAGGNVAIDAHFEGVRT